LEPPQSVPWCRKDKSVTIQCSKSDLLSSNCTGIRSDIYLDRELIAFELVAATVGAKCIIHGGTLLVVIRLGQAGRGYDHDPPPIDGEHSVPERIGAEYVNNFFCGCYFSLDGD